MKLQNFGKIGSCRNLGVEIDRNRIDRNRNRNRSRNLGVVARNSNFKFPAKFEFERRGKITFIDRFAVVENLEV